MNIFENLMGKNPKEIIMNQMLGKIDNPMIKNLINMAQKGDNKNIEMFAKNLMKDQGKDFDKEFANFMNQFKS